MKAIVIPEKEWERRKTALLQQLELVNLRDRGPEITREELHRSFHYHVVLFLQSLEKE